MGLFDRQRTVARSRPAGEKPRPAAENPRPVDSPCPAADKPSQPRLPGIRPAAAPMTAESPSARRFGELLVTEAVITQDQLDVALRRQTVARSYMPLGQVLLACKLISRKQLTTMLQRYGKRSRLGAILVKAGRITRAQLDEALLAQRRLHGPLGRALITLRYIDELTMRDALCTQLHVNFFDLDKINVDQKLSRLISERYAVRHLIMPLFRADNILVVAMDDPSQAALVESLEMQLGLQIEVVTTTTAKLMDAMKSLYGPPLPTELHLFGRRNVLIGPVRDFFVADLAARTVPGVSVVPV